MKLRIALRANKPWWLSPVLIAIAIIFTFIISAAMIRWAGANPFAAFKYLLGSPLQSKFGITEAILSATPLVLTGGAVALAFRAGYWNIGAEGQLLAGAICATFVGLHADGIPHWLGIFLVVIAGAFGGMLWAFVPALLRSRLGIDEVVTTLLLNPVALLVVTGLLNGPWRNPETKFPETQVLSENIFFPRVYPGSRIHLGLIIGIVALAICWWVVGRTAGGLKMRAVGLAPGAARIAGLKVEKTLFTTALASGAIAGIAGAGEVAGVAHQLTDGISPGFGYTGVVVATLAALSFPAVLLISFVLGIINVGSFSASRALSIPSTIGEVVQAVLLTTVVSALVFMKFRIVLDKGKRHD
ncbi:MAG: ABC transporter permease [Actinomycetes bacterium]